MRYFKGIFLLLVFSVLIFADTKVFHDKDFPYRIMCSTDWKEIAKNDSLFVLQDSSPNKKTLLKLKRYTIAPPDVDLEPMSWARLNYSVNNGFTDGVGEVLWSDSSKNIKIGTLRAFELFAHYSQKIDGQIVWWAEYCRWTECNNYGYLAVIMGDTLDLQKNLLMDNSTYKSMMDSMCLENISTKTILRQPHTITIRKENSTVLKTRYDLLGRKEWPYTVHQNMLLLQQNQKTIQLQKKPAP